MKKYLFLIILSLTAFSTHAQVDLTASAGTLTASYTTLKGAIDAINAGTHQGVIVINITANTTETATATLGAIEGTSPLPVELISFTAMAEAGNRVALTWQTASETQNAGFDIERSTDANNWTRLKTVNGAGNGLVLLEYHEYDLHPLPGISYYRLKQTDFNGTYTYSETHMVEIAPCIDINLIPNPASEKLSVKCEQAENARIEIRDALGRPVNATFVSSADCYTYDVSALTPGFYYVLFELNERCETHTFLIRH